MSEWWEFGTIPNRKYRGGKEQPVKVSFFSVKFKGKAPSITNGFGGSSLPSDRWEASDEFGLLTNLIEKGSACVLGNVIRNLEKATSTEAPSMNKPLWNTFVRDMLYLLKQIDVL